MFDPSIALVQLREKYAAEAMKLGGLPRALNNLISTNRVGSKTVNVGSKLHGTSTAASGAAEQARVFNKFKGQNIAKNMQAGKAGV